MLPRDTNASRPLYLGLCLSLAACAQSPDSEPESATQEATYTWHADVAPIVATACAGCHSDGNIAPFSLTNYAEVAALASILPPAIETGAMPPWPPAAGCNEYDHDRSLSEAQRETLLTWIDEGTPEGDPAEAAPLPEPPLAFVPDAIMEMPEAYVAQTEPDDYRCFVLDGPELADTDYVTSFEVYPGERAVVHHVIAFLVDPEGVAEIEALDAADPEPGYTCFGSPTGEATGLAGTRWLGAWVPGQSQWTAPAGTGIPVHPGSRVILQMHYNTSSSAPLADRTSFGIGLADEVERPGMVMPFTKPGWALGSEPMTIPAGEASVTHSVAIDRAAAPLFAQLLAPIGAGPEDTVQISSGGLHMHLLGRSGSIAVRHASGDETCVLNVDDYDFGWQGSYALREPVALGPQDVLELTCEWDNSAENQPIIDGQVHEPKDVEWGDGSFDEMCLGTMYVSL